MAIFLPFIFSAPEAFRYFVLDYHSAREAGTWAARLLFKAGCLSRLAQAYFVALAATVALAVWRVARADGLADRHEAFLAARLEQWLGVAGPPR